MPLLSPNRRIPSPPHPRITHEWLVARLRPFVTPRRQDRIERVIERRLCSVTVVLERPYDPHNGAAVLRTAEALGLLQVHVVEGPTGFSFSHKVTQNADKWLDVLVHPTIDSCLDWLRSAGYVSWAALPPDTSPSSSKEGELFGAPAGARGGELAPMVSVDRPLALVFGNEHAGLTQAARAGCQRRFHLPMFGFSESLNLSVSVALALADVCARRRHLLGLGGDLSRSARQRLRAAYFARSTPHAADIITRELLD